ncbi:MAG: type IV pilus secretin PilQ family protein [Pseudomonadota bacterium]|nr:type IV pilus secretin PilQ family protein [Pseudomonadota bacterium]
MPSYSASRPARTLLAGLICGVFAATASAGQPVPPAAAANTWAQPAQAAPVVSHIDFRRGDDGAGRLIVTFSGEGATPDLRHQGNQVVVDLGRAEVPAELSKRLNVTDFATPVSSVNSSGRQIVLDVAAASDSLAYQRGNEYILEVTPKLAQAAQGGLSSTINAAAQSAAAAGARKTYTGKRVNFNFQDIPVRPVLQLIAEESNLNIVAADTVTGNVTVRLVDVPWDQALDLILQSRGLDKRREGNVIWVAPQAEIAKYEQDREDARIALENRQDLVTEYVRINYHSADAIFKALTEAKGIGNSQGGQQGGGAGGMQNDSGFLSPRGRLVADERTNTLMISDIPKKIDEMRRLINEIDRPVDQVVIESRIVIATESFARDLGARFGVAGRRTGSNRGALSGSLGNNRSVLNQATTNVPDGLNFNLPAAPASGINPAGIAYTLLGANFALDVELSAMQEQNRGEVISNPRILTTNQREAVIQQGREIGYVTTTLSSGGIAQPTVAFKDVLLELRVTPTITNDDRVFLNMAVSKNELDSWLSTTIGQVPIIAKRQITTAALIENGQTVVIGGVYEFSDRESVAKVPLLGDLPIIGNLFKNKSRSNDKVELLIFVTPKILRVQQKMH